MQFAVVSAALLGLLGVMLGHVLAGLIEDRAIQSTADFGETITRLGLVPALDAADLKGPLDAAAAARVDTAMRELALGSPELRPLRVKIFNADGVMVHSDDSALIGRAFDSEDLTRALAGEVVTQYTELENADEAQEREFTQALEVYVPMSLDASGTSGVAEVYLSWAPVAADIQHDRLVVYIVLTAALLLFYLVMARLVWQTSRRLRTSVEHNAYLAHHDTLTGLPNRALLLERMERSIAQARRNHGSVGVLLIDLDRFKEINDTLGHETGDQLLVRVGQRLTEELREVDTVARLGGDEFVALLPQIDGVPGAEAAAVRILDALHRPFNVDGIELAVEASVGVACYPEHGEEQGSLMQHADVAMYAAKENRGAYAVYDRGADGSSLTHITMLKDLRRALEEDQLSLHYQPKEELADGGVHSVEALLRWEHPQRGMIPPDEFIPVAEQTGLMGALTERVLTLALTQLCRWREAGLDLSVSVNLSARNLIDDELPARVARLAGELGADLTRVEVEVTESSAMADPARAAGVLQGLSVLGIAISVDDYGTGYSSLAYLRSLPIDTVKIDRFFVSRMLEQPDNAVIVRSTIEMARNLGLRVVAEGVEDAATRSELRDLGCDMAQGYFLSPPLPADRVISFLDAHQASPAGLPSAG